MKGVHKAKKPLKLHCNAGHIYVYKKGWFGNIDISYHLKRIANILSLKTLKKQHHVTCDSKDRDGVFKVHTKDGVVEFIPHESGLHYLDLKDQQESGVALVTTIKNNIEGYTKHEVEGAIKAHQPWAMLGCPTQKDFEEMVHANLIANYPVSQKDASDAYALFGQNLAGLRGKTVRCKPELVETEYVQIP